MAFSASVEFPRDSIQMKPAYIIRIRNEIINPRISEIETHRFVFSRNDIIEIIDDLRAKYKIFQRKSSVDFSYAAVHMEELTQDVRKIFADLKLKKELWEDFFYYALGDKDRSDKFQASPAINVIPLARIEDRKIEYRIDLDKKSTAKDIRRQLPCIASLTKEFSNIKHSRSKRAHDKYKRANEVLNMKKISHLYKDPATGKIINQNTTINDQIEEVLGAVDDKDNSRQVDHLRKIKQRAKKTGQ